MSKLQTKIPYAHKKVVSSRVSISSKLDEKENTSTVINCHNKSKPFTEASKEEFAIKGSKSPLKRRPLEDPKECSPPKQNAKQEELHKDVIHSSAIRALHSSLPSKLPGREDKIDELSTIFYESLECKKSATVYISGPPGTGKTACLYHIIQQPRISEGFKTVYINCTGIKSSGAVYGKVADELKLNVKGKTEKAFLNSIQNYLQLDKQMMLLILDEIDQLESKKQAILYSIFEWPLLPNAHIVLVGIANALDLTDRVLPRLKAKIQFQPIVISFAPYSKLQIIDILTERLKEVRVEKILSGGALQLLASKLAAMSGDIRRALNLARRVVELAEQNEQNGKTVTLQEVLAVVGNVYTTSSSLSSSPSNTSGEPFPIQQKLLICSALLVRQSSKSKALTLGKLHDVYRKICEKRNVGSLGLSEFISLAELVESRGVIKIQGKVKNRLSKIIMQWDENEVSTVLKDKELLASVLADTSYSS